MLHFAANLSMMFNEWPFLERFAAAANAGFTAVEYLFPYEHRPEKIAEKLGKNGLTQALFNLPPGDFSKGERGLAALPERFDELQQSVKTAKTYARATGVKRLHLMAGIANRADPLAQKAYRRAVIYTAEQLAAENIDLVLEPINGRDIPGYFLNDFAYAQNLISDLALPNLKLQFDIYHRQILHGDVTMALRAMLPMIGHIQIAGVPERHEPLGCELDYPFLYSELERLQYQGFIGCEYRPRAGTLDGLTWFSPFKSKRQADYLAGAIA